MDLPELTRPMPEPAVAGEPPSIVELIRRGALDAELGALAWLLVEARIPLVVAAPANLVERGVAAEHLRGLLASLRPDLGLAGIDGAGLDKPLTVLGARRLVRGERAGAVARGSTLAEVREGFGQAPPMGLSQDELSFLGLVLVLAEGEGSPIEAADPALSPLRPVRVVAAHYVRPLHRDEHGHAQLLPPAVLATYDEATGQWEHFAWGVIPEIAARLDRKAGDLEADLHHRTDDLGGLVAAGVTSIAEVGRLVTGYRVRYGHAHGPSN